MDSSMLTAQPTRNSTSNIMTEIEFKELKMGHISILTKAESPLVTGEDTVGMDTVLDYVYVTNATGKAAKSARNDTWYEDVVEYANEYTNDQFNEFMTQHFLPEMESVNEAKVEVVPDKDSAPKKKVVQK